MSATSEPNKWHFLRTAATAPAGAAKVQAVIVHSQKGYSGGAVYWDDMNLSMVVGPKSNYGLGTRNVATGDLDGDGKGEVIFMKGRYTDDPQAGLWVYEADGTDNGFSEPWHVNINAFATDSVCLLYTSPSPRD